jgi:hypothetical protein
MDLLQFHGDFGFERSGSDYVSRSNDPALSRYVILSLFGMTFDVDT